MTHLRNSKVHLDVRNAATGELALQCPAWPEFRMETLRPALRCDQASSAPVSAPEVHSRRARAELITRAVLPFPIRVCNSAQA